MTTYFFLAWPGIFSIRQPTFMTLHTSRVSCIFFVDIVAGKGSALLESIAIRSSVDDYNSSLASYLFNIHIWLDIPCSHSRSGSDFLSGLLSSLPIVSNSSKGVSIYCYRDCSTITYHFLQILVYLGPRFPLFSCITLVSFDEYYHSSRNDQVDFDSRNVSVQVKSNTCHSIRRRCRWLS